MLPTAVPSVLIHPTVHPDALAIEVHQVITPYKPKAWEEMLLWCNITKKYPNLVHDLTYGSPIGNPPFLTCSFIPKKLHSANDHAEVIYNYLIEEFEAFEMSRGLSIQQAHTFFGSHFWTAPLVTRSWSRWKFPCGTATDPDGFSTNLWLDASKNVTKYYPAPQFADVVSLFPQLYCHKSPEPAVALLVVDELLFQFISTNTTLDFEQVTSAPNQADPISCSDLGPANCKLKILFDLPVKLQEFFVHV